MASVSRVQIAQRGIIVLPKSLRDSYGLEQGDILTLVDLGGVFVLSQKESQIEPLAKQIKAGLEERGETLESTLKLLREERELHAG